MNSNNTRIFHHLISFHKLITKKELIGLTVDELRSFVHELDWCQNVRLAGLNNASVHNHFFQHEVCLLEMEHDIKLTLCSCEKRNKGLVLFYTQEKPYIAQFELPQITRETYHVAKVAVHGFNQQMYEFQNSQLILPK